MNVEGLTLKLLLTEQDRDLALKSYSELKTDYFSPQYKTIYSKIAKYYSDRGEIPTDTQLGVYYSRDSQLLREIGILALIKDEGATLDLAIEALSNQYIQSEALHSISQFLNQVSHYDRHEIIDHMAGIPLSLEDKLVRTENTFSIKTVNIYKEEEELQLTRFNSGISDEWDQESGGYFLQDLILFGGKRGTGKSFLCANLVAAQHRQGNPSVYFTIEMTADEVYMRIIAILAGVPFKDLKLDTLSPEDEAKVSKTMASMFVGGEDVYNKHYVGNPAPDRVQFQRELQQTCEEKEEGRIIIIDDRELSVTTVDTKISSLKARYGDKLKLAVVDYLNQLKGVNPDDMYDWKAQMVIPKLLKNQARKFEMCIVSPYQMDDEGKARFSRGILDACDVAHLIEADHKEAGFIELKTDKARSVENDKASYVIRIDNKNFAIDPRVVTAQEFNAVIEQTAMEKTEQEVEYVAPKLSSKKEKEIDLDDDMPMPIEGSTEL